MTTTSIIGGVFQLLLLVLGASLTQWGAWRATRLENDRRRQDDWQRKRERLDGGYIVWAGACHSYMSALGRSLAAADPPYSDLGPSIDRLDRSTSALGQARSELVAATAGIAMLEANVELSKRVSLVARSLRDVRWLDTLGTPTHTQDTSGVPGAWLLVLELNWTDAIEDVLSRAQAARRN